MLTTEITKVEEKYKFDPLKIEFILMTVRGCKSTIFYWMSISPPYMIRQLWILSQRASQNYQVPNLQRVFLISLQYATHNRILRWGHYEENNGQQPWPEIKKRAILSDSYFYFQGRTECVEYSLNELLLRSLEKIGCYSTSLHMSCFIYF